MCLIIEMDRPSSNSKVSPRNGEGGADIKLDYQGLSSKVCKI